MALTICFYEDDKYSNFYPLTYTRPVYALRAGIVPLFARARWYFGDARIALSCRDDLAGVMAETHKDYPVNIIKQDDSGVLLLNGRIRNYGDLPKLVNGALQSTRFDSQGETVAVFIKTDSALGVNPMTTAHDLAARVQSEGNNLARCDTSATTYNYLWEIMSDIDSEIIADFRSMEPMFAPTKGVRVHDGVFWVNPDDVYLGNDVEIMPGAVIDASKGPVYIGDLTRIESHAAVYGPTSIGPNSVVLAGKISSCSIGHTCRVGGEIEESVFQSYVNKYHAGFIGHSYIGSWVNFGAMTTNSDLKNNYANIRVSLNGSQIDSGSNKVGSFIGDHSKFGIGTLLNTGINVGVACNIFGGGLVTDREVPSFQWGTTGSYVQYEVEKAVETARVVASRRNHTLTENEEKLLRQIASGETAQAGVIRI